MKKELFYTIITAIAFFALGLVVGMLLQQANTQATIVKVASNLEGIEINIDINETQILQGAEKMADKMIEEMKKEIPKENYPQSAIKNCTRDLTGRTC